jgi:hypothetical protein
VHPATQGKENTLMVIAEPDSRMRPPDTTGLSMWFNRSRPSRPTWLYYLLLRCTGHADQERQTGRLPSLFLKWLEPPGAQATRLSKSSKAIQVYN